MLRTEDENKFSSFISALNAMWSLSNWVTSKPSRIGYPELSPLASLVHMSLRCFSAEHLSSSDEARLINTVAGKSKWMTTVCIFSSGFVRRRAFSVRVSINIAASVQKSHREPCFWTAAARSPKPFLQQCVREANRYALNTKYQSL